MAQFGGNAQNICFPTAIKLKKKEDGTVGLKMYVNTSINLNKILIGLKEVV